MCHLLKDSSCVINANKKKKQIKKISHEEGVKHKALFKDKILTGLREMMGRGEGREKLSGGGEAGGGYSQFIQYKNLKGS